MKRKKKNSDKYIQTIKPKLLGDGVVLYDFGDKGTITFGEKVPMTKYVNEPQYIEFEPVTKIEMSYCDRERGLFTVEEYDTETGERKVLRQYSLKDMQF